MGRSGVCSEFNPIRKRCAANKTCAVPMRVLIVDDHPIIASGCRALLAGDPDIEILDAADAESGERAFLAEKLK